MIRTQRRRRSALEPHAPHADPRPGHECHDGRDRGGAGFARNREDAGIDHAVLDDDRAHLDFEVLTHARPVVRRRAQHDLARVGPEVRTRIGAHDEHPQVLRANRRLGELGVERTLDELDTADPRAVAGDLRGDVQTHALPRGLGYVLEHAFGRRGAERALHEHVQFEGQIRRDVGIAAHPHLRELVLVRSFDARRVESDADFERRSIGDREAHRARLESALDARPIRQDDRSLRLRATTVGEQILQDDRASFAVHEAVGVLDPFPPQAITEVVEVGARRVGILEHEAGAARAGRDRARVRTAAREDRRGENEEDAQVGEDGVHSKGAGRACSDCEQRARRRRPRQAPGARTVVRSCTRRVRYGYARTQLEVPR